MIKKPKNQLFVFILLQNICTSLKHNNRNDNMVFYYFTIQIQFGLNNTVACIAFLYIYIYIHTSADNNKLRSYFTENIIKNTTRKFAHTIVFITQ